MSEKMSLNQKIKKLDEQIEWFYSDDFELEKAIDKYQESINLAKKIEEDLNTLKNEIEIISRDFSK